MGALPKRKYAKARRGERRMHLKLIAPTLVECRQCHSMKPAHQVCPICGTYSGREVIRVESRRPRE